MTDKDLSLLSRFDDICRGFNFWMNDPFPEFEIFARNQNECRKKWLYAEEERSSAARELHEAKATREKLELQVRHVTELLKNEMQIRQRLQKEEKDLERKLNMVRQIVSADRNIAEETRDKLVSISSLDSYYRYDLESPGDHLIDTTSEEVESSTRSMLSSLDVTAERTEEDLELSLLRSMREVRIKPLSDLQANPRRNEANHPAQETTPRTIPKTPEQKDPTTAKNDARIISSANRMVRQHNLSSKVILKQEICVPCKTRIRFGKSAMKCVNCFMTCHVECKATMPTPCVPTVRTPSRFVGSIADYAPKTSPMVPALLVHCLDEIELRGLEQSGIYRVNAPEKEIHALKEHLLNGKVRAGQMTAINIHVVAGVVRSFLSSLKEPLVTFTSRESFTKISYIQDETDVQMAVCSLVPDLPQPNRDTLAYLMLHLQRVAASRSCRMSVTTLAKTFAPIILGNSRSSPDDGLKKLQDMKEQQIAMEKLLSVSSDYWSCYGRFAGVSNTPTYSGSKRLSGMR